jgi:hypothetical protein
MAKTENEEDIKNSDQTLASILWHTENNENAQKGATWDQPQVTPGLTYKWKTLPREKRLWEWILRAGYNLLAGGDIGCSSFVFLVLP